MKKITPRGIVQHNTERKIQSSQRKNSYFQIKLSNFNHELAFSQRLIFAHKNIKNEKKEKNK